ncbi:MAG: hypothetical protein ACI828_002276 [Flavobacteriales bacterium]|jgi:hypothetical protein
MDLIRIFQSESYFLSGSRETTHWHPFHLLLTTVQYISIPLFIFLGYSIFSEWSPAGHPFDFIQILAGYILFIMTKNMLEFGVSWILGIQPYFKGYFFKKTSYRNILGLVLLVLCCFLLYSQLNTLILFYVSLGLLGLVLLISIVNFGSKYRSEIIAHPFYFILYFCALELAPYYIVYKVIAA